MFSQIGRGTSGVTFLFLFNVYAMWLGIVILVDPIPTIILHVCTCIEKFCQTAQMHKLDGREFIALLYCVLAVIVAVRVLCLFLAAP